MEIFQVAVFPYPSVNLVPRLVVMEILGEDSRQLLMAMKKKYPNCNFNTRTEVKGIDTKLILEAQGINDLQCVSMTYLYDLQCVSMTYFAEGFMASAHLWER